MQQQQHIKNLVQSAVDQGDNLSSAGQALEAIARLMGLDGSEHHIDQKDMAGLLHAVAAIGAYVGATGDKLYEAGEMAGALEVSK
jgi:hypothetical protein